MGFVRPSEASRADRRVVAPRRVRSVDRGRADERGAVGKTALVRVRRHALRNAEVVEPVVGEVRIRVARRAARLSDEQHRTRAALSLIASQSPAAHWSNGVLRLTSWRMYA